MDTVSLDRVTHDGVIVEPAEAYAVGQFVWERLRQSRDKDGRMMPLPALGALVISATGDIDATRRTTEVSRTMRRPHEMAQELGHLLCQLVSSGRPDLVGLPVACLDAIRRVSLRIPVPGGLRPILAPEALFTALEMFRPRDAYAARAALFARWSSSRSARTVSGEARPGHRVARELRLQLDSTLVLPQPHAGGGVSARDGLTGPDPKIARGRLSLIV